MKKILYSLIAASAIISCGDDELKNPNYPVEPSIKFVDLKFKESEEIENHEELILTISYKDGDSDLGLEYNGEDVLYPYHSNNLFLADGMGDTTMIPSVLEYHLSGNLMRAIVKPVPQTGTLVTSATRENPAYSYLPENNPVSNCPHYQSLTHYYFDENILDQYFDVRETVTIDNKNFKAVNDLILIKPNENSDNISVKFYYFDSGEFVEYSWPGCQTFNGRFPLIEDKKSGTIKGGPFKIKVKNQWEGEIIYTMQSDYFLATFGNRALKLVITIKDRALHTSNTIVTSVFELNEIR